MSEFAIVATHRLKPGQRQQWVEHALKNARMARQEQGCLQFDVILPRDEPDAGILIEKYVDQEAWDFHFKQPYCLAFMKAVDGMLQDRSRVLCDLVHCQTGRGHE